MDSSLADDENNLLLYTKLQEVYIKEIKSLKDHIKSQSEKIQILTNAIKARDDEFRNLKAGHDISKSEAEFSVESAFNAIVFHSISFQAYDFARNTLDYPLPKADTLGNLYKSNDFEDFFLSDILERLSEIAQNMTELDRNCILQFYTHTVQSFTSFVKTKTVFFAMIRGVANTWKQPLCISYRPELLLHKTIKDLSEKLYRVGFKVVACIMESTLIHPIIPLHVPSIPHPVTGEQIFIAVDIPHLLQKYMLPYVTIEITTVQEPPDYTLCCDNFAVSMSEFRKMIAHWFTISKDHNAGSSIDAVSRLISQINVDEVLQKIPYFPVDMDFLRGILMSSINLQALFRDLTAKYGEIPTLSTRVFLNDLRVFVVDVSQNFYKFGTRTELIFLHCARKLILRNNSAQSASEVGQYLTTNHVLNRSKNNPLNIPDIGWFKMAESELTKSKTSETTVAESSVGTSQIESRTIDDQRALNAASDSSKNSLENPSRKPAIKVRNLADLLENKEHQFYNASTQPGSIQIVKCESLFRAGEQAKIVTTGNLSESSNESQASQCDANRINLDQTETDQAYACKSKKARHDPKSDDSSNSNLTDSHNESTRVTSSPTQVSTVLPAPEIQHNEIRAGKPNFENIEPPQIADQENEKNLNAISVQGEISGNVDQAPTVPSKVKPAINPKVSVRLRRLAPKPESKNSDNCQSAFEQFIKRSKPKKQTARKRVSAPGDIPQKAYSRKRTKPSVVENESLTRFDSCSEYLASVQLEKSSQDLQQEVVVEKRSKIATALVDALRETLEPPSTVAIDNPSSPVASEFSIEIRKELRKTLEPPSTVDIDDPPSPVGSDFSVEIISAGEDEMEEAGEIATTALDKITEVVDVLDSDSDDEVAEVSQAPDSVLITEDFIDGEEAQNYDLYELVDESS